MEMKGGPEVSIGRIVRRGLGALGLVATTYLTGCAAGQGALDSLNSPTPSVSAPANPTGAEPRPTNAPEATRKQETPVPKPSPTSAPVDIATGGTDPKSVISAEDLVQLDNMFGRGSCAADVGASNINGPENIVSLGRVPPEVIFDGVTFKLQEQARTSGAIYVNEAGKQIVLPTVVQGAMTKDGRLFFITKSVVCKNSETGGYSVRFADGDSKWRKDGSVSWIPVTVDNGSTASYDDLGNLVMRDASHGLKGVFISDDPRDPDYGKWDRSPMAQPVKVPEPTKVVPPSPTAPAPKPTDAKVNVAPTAVGVNEQAPLPDSESRFYKPAFCQTYERVVDGIKMKFTVGVTEPVVKRDVEPIKSFQEGRPDGAQQIMSYLVEMSYMNYKTAHPEAANLSLDGYRQLLASGKGKLMLAAVDERTAKSKNDRTIVEVDTRNLVYIADPAVQPVTLTQEDSVYLGRNAEGGLVIVCRDYSLAKNLQERRTALKPEDVDYGGGVMFSNAILSGLSLIGVADNKLLLYGSYVGVGGKEYDIGATNSVRKVYKDQQSISRSPYFAIVQ